MPEPFSEWTVLPLLRWTADHFRGKGIDSPRAAAEILLAHALGCGRIDLYLRFDQPVTADERDRFRALVRRRLRREPVAYITGQREFWSLPLSVDDSVLIPRPDTECLVEAALTVLPEAGNARWRVLELGTGSGAVILALASERPGHRFVATDLSPAAVATARANARRSGLETAMTFFAGDWFAPLSTGGTWNLVVCNPPYIATSALAHLAPEVAAFEPRQALDGGPHGLDHLRRLIDQAPQHLGAGGYLMLELGSDQRRAVEDLARRVPGYDQVGFRKDYAGRDRVVCLRRGAV
jgi:release factor glutamine methyltransferase